MTVTYGSRRIELDPPEIHDLRKLSKTRDKSREYGLRAVYQAGALAALKQIEDSRGARHENLLLEVSRE